MKRIFNFGVSRREYGDRPESLFRTEHGDQGVFFSVASIIPHPTTTTGVRVKKEECVCAEQCTVLFGKRQDSEVSVKFLFWNQKITVEIKTIAIVPLVSLWGIDKEFSDRWRKAVIFLECNLPQHMRESGANFSGRWRVPVKMHSIPVRVPLELSSSSRR